MSNEDSWNEDWVKTRTWDLTDVDGEPVETLDGVARLWQVTRGAAAARLMSSAMAQAAPKGVLTDAQAVVAGTADGGAPPPLPSFVLPPVRQQKVIGTFVRCGDVVGRVDMVVRRGVVPGVTSAAIATDERKLARVATYTPDGAGYVPTGDKVALPLSDLVPTPPPLPGGTGPETLPTVLAAWYEQAPGGMPLPAGGNVRQVYDRGVQAWPGEAKAAMSPHDWAMCRVVAFLGKCSGDDVPGYVRDDDLLPQHVDTPGR